MSFFNRNIPRSLDAPERKRLKAYRAGLLAERCCLLLLRLKGYRLVAHRYRSPFGEIDIIVTRGDVVAMVEVKARPTRTLALEAVTSRQLQRLHRAAQDFLARHPRFNRHNIRFDVMIVASWRWPQHIVDAWRP